MTKKQFGTFVKQNWIHKTLSDPKKLGNGFTHVDSHLCCRFCNMTLPNKRLSDKGHQNTLKNQLTKKGSPLP